MVKDPQAHRSPLALAFDLQCCEMTVKMVRALMVRTMTTSLPATATATLKDDDGGPAGDSVSMATVIWRWPG